MPRPENQNQYKYGPYDYRTAAEDRQLAEREQQGRADEDAHRQVMESIRRQNRENQRRQEEAQRKREQQRQNQLRRQSNTRKKSQPKSTEDDWNTGAAVIGFFMGAGWVANQMSGGEDAAIPILIAGVIGAIIAGKFYKFILALGILALIAWVLASSN